MVGDDVVGLRGTYQGLTATIMKQGSNQAIRFFVMETLKEKYRGDDKNKKVPKLVVGAFGGIAGACSVFGNTPLDVIKTRMQVTCLIGYMIEVFSCFLTRWKLEI